jgi:hypothetical protein
MRGSMDLWESAYDASCSGDERVNLNSTNLPGNGVQHVLVPLTKVNRSMEPCDSFFASYYYAGAVLTKFMDTFVQGMSMHTSLRTVTLAVSFKEQDELDVNGNMTRDPNYTLTYRMAFRTAAHQWNPDSEPASSLWALLEQHRGIILPRSDPREATQYEQNPEMSPSLEKMETERVMFLVLDQAAAAVCFSDGDGLGGMRTNDLIADMLHYAYTANPEDESLSQKLARYVQMFDRRSDDNGYETEDNIANLRYAVPDGVCLPDFEMGEAVALERHFGEFGLQA